MEFGRERVPVHCVAGEDEQVDGALIDGACDVVNGGRANAYVQVADVRDAQLHTRRQLVRLDDMCSDLESVRLDEHSPQEARDSCAENGDRSESAATSRRTTD